MGNSEPYYKHQLHTRDSFVSAGSGNIDGSGRVKDGVKLNVCTICDCDAGTRFIVEKFKKGTSKNKRRRQRKNRRVIRVICDLCASTVEI